MTALDQLTTIIPADQALANKALASSMTGITGINQMSLPQLAQTTSNVQSMFGLPQINAQTAAVPPAAAANVVATVGTGTGQNGTLKIVDILGTAAGEVSTKAMTASTAAISSMGTGTLLSCYNNMYLTVTGAFTEPSDVDPLQYQVNIPSGPGAGIYGPYTTPTLAINAAFTSGLIPAAQSLIVSTAGANPSQTAILNKNFNDIIAQLNLEKANQAKANLVFANLTPNCTQAVYSFVFSLPSYGQDSTVGGVNQFLQALTVTSNYGGQAIVGTLRQGQTNLGGTGVGSNANVPSNPNPPIPPAPLSNSSYPYP